MNPSGLILVFDGISDLGQEKSDALDIALCGTLHDVSTGKFISTEMCCVLL
jgi:hypothetical protein